MSRVCWLQTFDSAAEEYFYYNTGTHEISYDEPEEGYGTLEEDRTVQAAVAIQSAHRSRVARRRLAARREEKNSPDAGVGAKEEDEDGYDNEDFDSDEYFDEDFDDDEDVDEEEPESEERSTLFNASSLDLQKLDDFLETAKQEANEARVLRNKAITVRLDAQRLARQKEEDARQHLEKLESDRQQWRRRLNLRMDPTKA